MHRFVLILLFVSLLVAINTPHINANEEEENDKPKAHLSKFSKKIDINKIEKAWQNGDEADELENEFDTTKKVAEKMKKRKKGSKNSNQAEELDPKLLAEKYRKDPLSFQGGVVGTAMLFVELNTVLSDGSPWTKKDVDHLAMKWTSLMKSGSLPGAVYNVGDQKASNSAIDKEPKLLVTLEKNWMTKELMRFLLTQPETVKVTKDSRDFTKVDLDDDGDEL